MSDHPMPRLSDAQLAMLERFCAMYVPPANPEDPSMVSVVEVLPALRELIAARALLADLKAEGCPWRASLSMDQIKAGLDEGEYETCAYCGGPVIDEPGEEPRYNHRPMEDGKPCLWLRVESACVAIVDRA